MHVGGANYVVPKLSARQRWSSWENVREGWLRVVSWDVRHGFVSKGMEMEMWMCAGM